MSQTPINKSLAKNICKHKAGDTWKEGCCGEDLLLAQNYFETLEEQENDSTTSVKQLVITDKLKTIY